MRHINKLRLLTDTEGAFIEASKKERTKARFKNPAVIKNRLKEKSKNLLLAIPYIIEDINSLYKFGIEEGLKGAFDVDKLTTDDFEILYETMPFLITNDFDSACIWLSNFFNSMSTDAKKTLFVAVSGLYWDSPDEYEEIAKQTCKDIRNFHDYGTSQIPIIKKTISTELEHIENFHKAIADYPVVKLLNDLSPNERFVALAVFKSKNGITRDGIADKTGLHKRFVTRYTNSLVKKNIIKSKNIGGIDYFKLCTKS